MRLIRLLKNDLAQEAHEWVVDGLVTEEQAEQICARYGADYRNAERHSFGYRVLVGLGLLFIGLSLLTLIGANWQDIPREVRTGGLFLLVMVTHLRGWSNLRAGDEGGAVGWFFLGCLFYGSAIMLIAQIYHIGEHYPDGVLWWALGVLPFAMLMQSSLLVGLMLVLAYIWLFVETGMGFFPVWFPLFLLAAAYHLYIEGRNSLIFLAVVAGAGLFLEYTLSWYLAPQPGFDVGQENLLLAGGLFLLFQGWGKWLDTRPEPRLADYGTLLQLWVLRFFVVYLVYFSFEGAWEEFLSAEWQLLGETLALVAVFSGAGLWLAWRAGRAIQALAVGTALFWGMLGMALLSPSLPPLLTRTGDVVVFQVISNLVLISMGVWLVARGIQARISHYFHVGVGVILLTGMLRYIDLVGNYVGAAILFAFFAAILLFAARYWKETAAGESS